jgi:AraC-like DNA-binding protein
LFLFHPDSVKARQRTAARVHLTAFRIGGEEVTSQTFSGRRRVMNGALMDCRKFSLAYSETAFQMDFSLLDFSDAQATVFQYRMADDDLWMQAPEGQNTITFNHLAPGNYHLQVRASVAGVQTPVEDYFIEIRAPWWLSTLAYVIYVLVFILVVLMAAFVYNRHLQHQTDREKLQVLMSAIHAEDTPLTLDEMRKAIGGYVQNRKRQHGIYGDTAAVATRIDAPNVRSEDELLMDRVVQSVNRHLSDSEYTTEQLCQEVGVSRAQLHRKMKELTGLAASDFVRGIRLEQAARLLREHKMGIAQVAYSVGFATAGHFSTVFKKHFGVSPSQYAPEQNTEE